VLVPIHEQKNGSRALESGKLAEFWFLDSGSNSSEFWHPPEIGRLQDSARAMLIHAHHNWTSVIDHHVWPYALRTANDVFNHATSQVVLSHLSNSLALLTLP